MDSFGEKEDSTVQKTVLNSVHQDLGARLVEFGGFEMPVWYSTLTDEHHTVRKSAGLFDLCHMGRYEITGDNAVAAVDSVVTNHVAKMKTGQIRYSLVLNEQGGVRDDILIYRLPDRVWLVVNAGNREKLLGWFGDHLTRPGMEFRDRSEEVAMIALQGPTAESLLAPHVKTTWVKDLPSLGYYKISDLQLEIGGCSSTGWVSRTGYTGEDGFELYVPSDEACDVWNALASTLGDAVKPCGLGCRDTLRLEAGMPLYGHELDEETDPLSAGLDFGVRMKKPNGFIGHEALAKIQADGPTRRLQGFVVEGKRPARQGCAVFAGDREVGVVTSGSPSPTLEVPIACAYVASDVPLGTALEVDIRGTRAPLRPVDLPFYKRPKTPQ